LKSSVRQWRTFRFSQSESTVCDDGFSFKIAPMPFSGSEFSQPTIGSWPNAALHFGSMLHDKEQFVAPLEIPGRLHKRLKIKWLQSI
jgi:hypothetical protein